MKTNKIKLAIFDVDDTLIKRGKLTIEPSALEAIKAMEKKGIEIMVATGRAYYFVHDAVFEQLNPDYMVTTNGACVYNKQRTLIFKAPLLDSEVNDMIAYARDHHLGIALKKTDSMPVYNDLNLFETVYMQGSSKQHILVDKTSSPYEMDPDDPAFGIFMMGNEAEIENSRSFCPNGIYAKAYTNAYDIYSKDAGKIKGIDVVLEKMKLTWENVIAFGDAANDKQMLMNAQIGVAMGNAPDSIKEIATYVTTDIEKDGIYNAIAHFQLF